MAVVVVAVAAAAPPVHPQHLKVRALEQQLLARCWSERGLKKLSGKIYNTCRFTMYRK